MAVSSLLKDAVSTATREANGSYAVLSLSSISLPSNQKLIGSVVIPQSGELILLSVQEDKMTEEVEVVGHNDGPMSTFCVWKLPSYKSLRSSPPSTSPSLLTRFKVWKDEDLEVCWSEEQKEGPSGSGWAPRIWGGDMERLSGGSLPFPKGLIGAYRHASLTVLSSEFVAVSFNDDQRLPWTGHTHRVHTQTGRVEELAVINDVHEVHPSTGTDRLLFTNIYDGAILGTVGPSLGSCVAAELKGKFQGSDLTRVGNAEGGIMAVDEGLGGVALTCANRHVPDLRSHPWKVCKKETLVSFAFPADGDSSSLGLLETFFSSRGSPRRVFAFHRYHSGAGDSSQSVDPASYVWWGPFELSSLCVCTEVGDDFKGVLCKSTISAHGGLLVMSSCRDGRTLSVAHMRDLKRSSPASTPSDSKPGSDDEMCNLPFECLLRLGSPLVGLCVDKTFPEGKTEIGIQREDRAKDPSSECAKSRPPQAANAALPCSSNETVDCHMWPYGSIDVKVLAITL
uniref:Uncharacterized protein n=1 Tax=Chromera velia CCMP2878 TaxID=1169474 RepID=A0A0G4FC79_9ALVE|eukprot:Cvel_3197.t1-p1 / transcript=Cvel_3197.t1 / gene=Cvel_3197 / organism=Chromera_velia_CCMP2878 / gene_product=hypothetical protein / transcript_product=hypothetical protein / location=Cvel_scaffold124:124436-126890(-) / protein_length=509 / sequence_SO=supercontig / SO=protein_coding / is_pseudo=false